MQNKGAGIALNTWGVITKIDTGEFYRFRFTYFIVPDKPKGLVVYPITEALDFMFPNKEFNGYSIYPQQDINNEDAGIRLLVTYNDVFGNKFLVVFDNSDLFGWRQIEEAKRIEQRLDEYLVEKTLL